MMDMPNWVDADDIIRARDAVYAVRRYIVEHGVAKDGDLDVRFDYHRDFMRDIDWFKIRIDILKSVETINNPPLFTGKWESVKYGVITQRYREKEAADYILERIGAGRLDSLRVCEGGEYPEVPVPPLKGFPLGKVMAEIRRSQIHHPGNCVSLDSHLGPKIGEG